MRHLSVSLLTVLTALILGCGPGKELPTEVRHPEPAKPPSDPNGTPPAASDPAAKAIIDRAVNAITANDPGKLAKVKVAKVTYQGGGFKLGQTHELTKATCLIETVWPDSAYVRDEFKEIPADFKGEAITTFYMKSPHGWMKGGDRVVEQPPLEMGRVIRTDLMAWHWLLLGLPLTDAKAIVFEPNKGATTTTVKLAVPDFPVFLLTFDNGSGLPVKSEVHPLENQRRVRKVFNLLGHTAMNGLMVPTKVEHIQGDSLVLQWEQPVWEFPETIDPSRFEKPK